MATTTQLATVVDGARFHAERASSPAAESLRAFGAPTRASTTAGRDVAVGLAPAPGSTNGLSVTGSAEAAYSRSRSCPRSASPAPENEDFTARLSPIGPRLTSRGGVAWRQQPLRTILPASFWLEGRLRGPALDAGEGFMDITHQTIERPGPAERNWVGSKSVTAKPMRIR